MDMKDKFAYSDGISNESGGLVLTADGCMNRHHDAADDRRLELRDMRHEEAGINLTHGMSAVREDRTWLAVAYELKRFGLKPTTESLEDFVAQHQDLLERGE